MSGGRRVAPTSSMLAALLLPAALLLLPPRAAAAQGLLLDLVPPSQTGPQGSTLTFTGRITNTTGVALNSTDLFLNFIGYDPAALPDITQVLGNSSFVLPNNTFSAIVPLFTVLLAPAAPVASYGISVTLQDINNVASDPAEATAVVTAAPNVVPEPSTLTLLVGGVLLVPSMLARRRRRSRPGAAAGAESARPGR